MNVDNFIEIIHKGQKRKTGDPFTSHLYAVRDILVQEGITDTTVLNAALLHDALEDTDVTREYLAFRFGNKVADIVFLISKTEDWNTAYCKVKSHLDLMEESWMKYPEAIVVKMADRLHNLRTIHGFNPEKQKEYIAETKECLIPLFERVLDHNKIGYFRKYITSLMKKLKTEVDLIEGRMSSLT